eukprot:PITA_04966
MEKSVLLVVLIVGVFVFGEFKHAIAERSGGKYHLPQKGKPHSPSYAPIHSPKSQSPHHPPYSSFSMVPGPSVLSSIHHSSAPSIRTFTSTSPSPSFFKPGMSVAPMASICKCTTKSIFACFSECISPGPSPSQSFLKAAKSVAPVATMSTTLQQTKPLKSTRHEIQHLKVLIIVAIALVLLILGAIIILFTYWTCTWVSRSRLCPVLPSSQPPALRKQSDIDDSDANNGMSLGPLLTRFSSFRTGKRKGCASAMEYSVLQAATNNFSSYNLLGQGGFGSVYRAQFPDDFCVAVKMLDENRKQADDEFQSEVELMSKIRHPNLVSLLGFCVHGKTRLLVYELMQNGSLEAHLHGPSHGSALTWHLRMKIALDTAR